MTLEEELEHVKREYPQAWSYLLGVDPMQPTLPKFDDNDEMFFSRQEKEERQCEQCTGGAINGTK